MDLFDIQNNGKEGPLAARMRPRNLEEYIGQDHIVGKGRLLRRAIAADQLTSVIFYGPPGTGKTTLAKVIANHTKSNFITINAVLAGVQSIRDAIKAADEQHKLYNKKTILFVDEVHRWNKSQQDALLPWVENGTIILVGATTENPFFEVNKALVSRSRVFQLKPLTKEDLHKAAEMALNDKERGYGNWTVRFEEGALEHLIETANGDARSLLNALELAVETTPEKWPPEEGSEIYISKNTAEESIQKKVVLYDKDGDYHYDIISAFIKSLRGRDPDAALYWLARMVRAGEDPHFIFRRMLISACEDTGLADPFALGIVESCAAAFDRIGMPEGQYMLTQAALYLSTAPKSNSAMAFFDAMTAVNQEDADVPNHLKDNSRDAEGFGHGAGYLYPHAYRDHWVAQQYLPDNLDGRVFYNPGDQGYEKTIRSEVLSRRELQIAALLETEVFMGEAEKQHLRPPKKGENLTFSPGDNTRNTKQQVWEKRTESNRTALLLEIRKHIIKLADLKRHYRSLVFGADDGLFLWEIWRSTPEGCTAGLCSTKRGYDILQQYASTLPEIEKPVLDYMQTPADENITLETKASEKFSSLCFDRIFYRNPVTEKKQLEQFAGRIKQLFESGSITNDDTVLLIAQKIPCESQRLSELLLPFYPAAVQDASFDANTLLKEMHAAEDAFYSGASAPETVKDIFSWNHEDFQKTLEASGFEVTVEKEDFLEERTLSKTEIENWFSAETTYGSVLHSALGEEKISRIKELFLEQARHRTFRWKQTTAFFHLVFKR